MLHPLLLHGLLLLPHLHLLLLLLLLLLLHLVQCALWRVSSEPPLRPWPLPHPGLHRGVHQVPTVRRGHRDPP